MFFSMTDWSIGVYYNTNLIITVELLLSGHLSRHLSYLDDKPEAKNK